MTTDAKIAANRRNAQLSSGPTSDAGKAKSCLNAVKTGLTGRTVLLPGDDASAYEEHLQRFFKQYSPFGDDEYKLTQSLADTEWRLLRIPSLEMGIYALGRLEFAELFPEENQVVRNQLIETKTFLAYQRQLSNVSTQEARLRRQREKDTAALREMQEHRKSEAKSRLNLAASAYLEAIRKQRDLEFDPAAFGFEFSFEELRAKAAEINPNRVAENDALRLENSRKVA